MFGSTSRKSFPISANAAIGALASRTSRGALFPDFIARRRSVDPGIGLASRK